MLAIKALPYPWLVLCLDICTHSADRAVIGMVVRLEEFWENIEIMICLLCAKVSPHARLECAIKALYNSSFLIAPTVEMLNLIGVTEQGLYF